MNKTQIKVDKYIGMWLHNFANTPLDKREDTFWEVVELKKGLIKILDMKTEEYYKLRKHKPPLNKLAKSIKRRYKELILKLK